MGQITGSIVAHRNDGMGARLIAMLNAVRVAQDHGLPWHVCWTTHGQTRPELREPTQIFDPDFVAAKFSDVETMQDLYEDLIDLSTVTAGQGRDGFLDAARSGRNFLSGAAMGVIVLPWEQAADVAARLPQALDQIRFSAPVRAMMARIDETLKGARLVAYHIRRGDIIHHPVASNKLWPNKYIPREFYELHLERTLEDPKARVICFSDTPQEVARLKARSDRVVSFDDLLGQSNLTLGARDFLELYAMSRCARIYGPPESAFSQTARTIGGGTLEAVQDALKPIDRAAALDLLSDRLEERSALFLNMGDVGQSLHFMIQRQNAVGNPGRAKRIIRDYMEAGLDKSFAYQLLCELSVSSGDLAYCNRVRAMAYERPVYVDDSMAVVNGYAALARLEAGHFDVARSHLLTAAWFRPLDPMIHGVANLALTAEVIDPDSFYPFDPDLVREKGNVFPAGKPALDALNAHAPQGVDAAGRKLFHPWELTVRDWRLVHGKRLNRAFSNKSKIERAREMIATAFSKMEGSVALASAQGVMDLALGDTEAALAAQTRAVAEVPDRALYHKRLSDVLFQREDEGAALRALHHACELAPRHPCYLAELGHRLHRIKAKDEALALHLKLAEIDHDFIEVHLMVAEALRRERDHLEAALAEMDKALTPGHGQVRLMAGKARLLMMLGREAEAREIYETMVGWGVGTEYTHVQILRMYREIGREDVARSLTERSDFDFETVRELADG